MQTRQKRHAKETLNTRKRRAKETLDMQKRPKRHTHETCQKIDLGHAKEIGWPPDIWLPWHPHQLHWLLNAAVEGIAGVAGFDSHVAAVVAGIAAALLLGFPSLHPRLVRARARVCVCRSQDLGHAYSHRIDRSLLRRCRAHYAEMVRGNYLYTPVSVSNPPLHTL